jgi:hypothetical protein
MITNLRWWLAELNKPSVYRELRPKDEIQDLGIYVDASISWGISIIIQGCWASFTLWPDWKIEGRDICWLETLALELLFYFLEAMDFKNVELLIHSDNQGAVGALDKGRSPNYHINLSICRLYTILIAHFITPLLKFVSSKENPANPISHRESGSPDLKLSYLFRIPDELKPIFVHAN